ncbi:helix-turn-helix transcriptional regulator [Streptomyces sp. YIM 98790]|uniref:helix-turn-helix domain-containing protein n=1 Tax=Streptomyces sp. YIM 98790 TaxID=2689077 RepID=UPI00140A191F|nr:helix-turn-helix transcriptional regulator [Streptomyces sp. YIM 98790]
MARREKELDDDVPDGLAALCKLLRELRREAGLTIKELSARCHYAPATLSAAASGAKLPTWPVVWQFAQACDPRASHAFWQEAWVTARLSVEAAGPDDGRAARRGGRRGAASSAASAPSAAPAPSAVPPAALGPARPDQRGTDLSLCDDGHDFADVLRGLLAEKDLRPQDVADATARLGMPLGARTVQRMAGVNAGLPSTEELHVFLLGCGLREEETWIWHVHAVRLKVAEVERRLRPGAVRSGRSAPRLLRGMGQWAAALVALLGAAQVLRTASPGRPSP